jgi:hypothetical protein
MFCIHENILLVKSDRTILLEVHFLKAEAAREAVSEAMP